MVELEKLQEKLGEALGLEMGAQKAVDELGSKGLLDKCSTMMQTYLGQDPDSSEAIEFLCLAEGGEVTHYEVLDAISKKLNGKMKNTKKLLTIVNSILREEKRHLALCTKLAKQTAIS